VSLTEPSSPERIVDLIFGRWKSQILYCGVRLGIFEVLEEDSPKSCDNVARELILDPIMAYRLMRALSLLGLLKEYQERKFSLTSEGKFLRKDNPQSLRGMALLEEGPHHYAIWKHLPAIIKDGKQNAFLREFGCGAFDYAKKDSEYAQVFNDAMSSYSATETTLVLEALAKYDFSKFSHFGDIAGGQGHLLCSFLRKYPHLKGTVLELPYVIENKDSLWSQKLGVADRCVYLPGDMFKEGDVPVADAYIMKKIIHDWDDWEAVKILSNIHKKSEKHATVFIAEMVIPEASTPHFSKLFDIHMMLWGTGRERTNEEYAELMKKAGWAYIKTWYSSPGPVSVIEGAKID
jgi:hypothetical protein